MTKKLKIAYNVALWEVKTDKAYNAEQLRMGIKVEYEHTNMKHIAKIIAKHHLDEFPDYYTRLASMERKAERFWRNKKK